MTDQTVATNETPAAPPDLVTRVFTFGHGHVCRYTGANLLDHHVTVIAPTAELCRELMLGLYGQAWAFEYVSLDAATRGGMYPSTEHARIVVPGEGYGREVDNGDASAEVPAGVEGVAPGAAIGRATVPEATCLYETGGGSELRRRCGAPIEWYRPQQVWIHKDRKWRGHDSIGPATVPPS